MNRKQVVATISIILLLLISFLSIRSCYKAKSIAKSPSAPTTINYLITNQMSDYKSTRRFDRAIESFMRRWELKGGSFALMRNDSLLYAKGYGLANDTLKCEVSNTFRIASASKLITATAVMKLVESGELSLDDQVFGEEGILNDSIFLDLRHPDLKKITVKHLLQHTSGLYSPLGDPAFANYSVAVTIGGELPLSLDDMVLYATKCRVRSRPGGSYDYSNLGYMILGKIIERVSSMEYESYVRDSVLAPIGCHDIYIGRNFSENRPPNEVQYYEVKEAEPVEAYDGSGRMTMKSDGGNNVTLLGGAGGWVASPVELLRLVAAINDCDSKPNILSDESIALMTRDDESEKPMGWANCDSKGWLRSGSMSGTSALIKCQPDGYTWVFVTNSSAWIGPRLSSHIGYAITEAISKVDEWTPRDLFAIEPCDSLEGDLLGDEE